MKRIMSLALVALLGQASISQAGVYEINEVVNLPEYLASPVQQFREAVTESFKQGRADEAFWFKAVLGVSFIALPLAGGVLGLITPLDENLKDLSWKESFIERLKQAGGGALMGLGLGSIVMYAHAATPFRINYGNPEVVEAAAQEAFNACQTNEERELLVNHVLYGWGPTIQKVTTVK